MLHRAQDCNSQFRTDATRPTARSYPRHAGSRPTYIRQPPHRVPEPTPVEKRIAEVWQAQRDGEIPLSNARVAEIQLNFEPYKNGNYGTRNRHGDVQTDAMTAAEYHARHGRTISEWTVRMARKHLAERFPWYGWIATPNGYSYQMDADGIMPMRGKRGIRVRASVGFSTDGSVLTKKKLFMKEESLRDTVSCGERPTDRPSRPGPTPPPDRVAIRLARLAAFEPDAAALAFAWETFGLGERYVRAEADRMRAWFTDPDHLERRAWAPVDPAVKFREWLANGARRKATREVEREAMDLRHQRAEAALAEERRLAGISPEYGDDDLADYDGPDFRDDGNHGDDSGEWWHLPDDDDGDDADAWRVRLTGSDDPPPPTRAEIIAMATKIAADVERGVPDDLPRTLPGYFLRHDHHNTTASQEI